MRDLKFLLGVLAVAPIAAMASIPPGPMPAKGWEGPGFLCEFEYCSESSRANMWAKTCSLNCINRPLTQSNRTKDGTQ